MKTYLKAATAMGLLLLSLSANGESLAIPEVTIFEISNKTTIDRSSNWYSHNILREIKVSGLQIGPAVPSEVLLSGRDEKGDVVLHLLCSSPSEAYLLVAFYKGWIHEEAESWNKHHQYDMFMDTTAPKSRYTFYFLKKAVRSKVERTQLDANEYLYVPSSLIRDNLDGATIVQHAVSAAQLEKGISKLAISQIYASAGVEASK